MLHFAVVSLAILMIGGCAEQTPSTSPVYSPAPVRQTHTESVPPKRAGDEIRQRMKDIDAAIGQVNDKLRAPK